MLEGQLISVKYSQKQREKRKLMGLSRMDRGVA